MDDINSVKKPRGRPKGYRKLEDGTWVKLDAPAISAAAIAAETDNIITSNPVKKPRGRPKGYRKLEDGTWVKLDKNGTTNTTDTLNAPIVASNQILVTEEIPAVEVKEPDFLVSDSAESILSFTHIVADPTLKDTLISANNHFIHTTQLENLFNAKSGLKNWDGNFYIDDPYNSLSEEELDDFYYWLEVENYFNHANTDESEQKRKFVIVSQTDKPLFILFTSLCRCDGSYPLVIDNKKVNNISPIPTTFSGLWGLFPSTRFNNLPKENKNIVCPLEFRIKGLCATKKSFSSDQFEIFFDTIISEFKDGTLHTISIEDKIAQPIQQSESSEQVLRSLEDDSEVEDSTSDKEQSNLEDVTEDPDEDNEDEEEEEEMGDYELDECKQHLSKKLSNEFVLDTDGIFRRKYGGASAFIAKESEFFDDTDVERSNYEAINDGCYRSINHQLYDDAGFEDYNDRD